MSSSLRCQIGIHSFSLLTIYPPRDWMKKPHFSLLWHCERCGKAKLEHSIRPKIVFVEDGLGLAPKEEQL